MSEPTNSLTLTTVLCCHNCAARSGLRYADAIGGTWQPEECPKCGSETYLREYLKNFTIEPTVTT